MAVLSLAALNVALLGGCHTRPDIIDKTGFNAVDIVHRIQCEAADRVRTIYSKRGFPHQFDHFKENVGEINKIGERKNAILKGIDPKGVPNPAYRPDQEFLAADGWTREEVRRSILLQIELLQVKIARATTEWQKGGETPELRNAQARALLAESDRLHANAERIARSIEAIKKIEAVEKELEAEQAKQAAYKELLAYRANTAFFTYVFQATENNNTNIFIPTFITWPIALGAFTLTTGVGEDKQRLTDKQVKLTATFEALLDLKCAPQDIDYVRDSHGPRRYPIVGNIGLGRVIDDYLATISKGRTLSASSINDSYQDKIEFTTTLKSSIQPSSVLNKKMGSSIQLGIVAYADRKDLHRVTVNILPPAPDKPAPPVRPQEILIKGMPEVRVRNIGAGPVD